MDTQTRASVVSATSGLEMCQEKKRKRARRSGALVLEDLPLPQLLLGLQRELVSSLKRDLFLKMSFGSDVMDSRVPESLALSSRETLCSETAPSALRRQQVSYFVFHSSGNAAGLLLAHAPHESCICFVVTISQTLLKFAKFSIK